MQTNFQPLLLTSLTPPEFKFLLRQELEAFFREKEIQDQSGNEENQLLNIKEAASLLKYSVPSIYRLINKKEIPSLKKRGKILFDKAELLAWAQEGRRKTVIEIIEDAEKHLGELGQKKSLLKIH